MKKLLATLCIVGSTIALAACTTQNTTSYDAGASYATDRTAGEIDEAPAPAPERVFKAAQTK